MTSPLAKGCIANTEAISSCSSSNGNGNGGSAVSFETLAAALILGLFAIFIVVYTVCLQCCWNNRRCPWFLGKDNVETPAKDKYTFCPCVQAIQSPDSWQSTDLEQVITVQDPHDNISHHTSMTWDDPLALVFVNMNVQVVVCDCGKTYKMSPEMARKFSSQRRNSNDCNSSSSDKQVSKLEINNKQYQRY